MRRSGFGAAIGISSLVLLASQASALVNLELRPSTQNAVSGEKVIFVELYAVATPPEFFGRVDVVLQWDAARLELVGHDDTGAFAWSFSGFPSNVLNASLTDGDASYQANVGIPCGNPRPEAILAGALITRLKFRSLGQLGAATVQIRPSLSGVSTQVLSHLTVFGCGGVPVTGTIGTPVSVSIDPCFSEAECDDGDACTTDTCSLTGDCQYTDTFILGEECCDPVSGNIVTISDGNDCTSDQCNAFTGQVTHQNLTGTTCGDATQNDCTNPDTCLSGVCIPNNVPDGAFCTANFGCVDNGMCSSGNCTGGTPVAQGTPCDDEMNCTNPGISDTCNAAGQCTGANPCSGNTPFCFEDALPPGYVCGECTSDGQCPPSVGCRINNCSPISHICTFITDNGACDDGMFCNGIETCEAATGNCNPGPGNPCALQGLGCNESTDSCVECFSTADCDNTDLCNPQICVLGQCVPDTPVFCAQDPVNEPCRISECNPAVGVCEFVLPTNVSCDADDPCPQGYSCTDPGGGTCFKSAGCSDGTGCTTGDFCCVPGGEVAGICGTGTGGVAYGECVGFPPTQVGYANMHLVNPSNGGATIGPVLVGQAVDVRFEVRTAQTTEKEVQVVEATLEWNPVKLGPPVTATDPCNNGSSDNGCICAGSLCLDVPCTICLGEYDWFSSGFLSNFDPDNLNATFLDGDAHYEAIIEPGQSEVPGIRNTNPLKVTTFRFFAQKATTVTGTKVNFNLCKGNIGTRSRVIIAGADDIQTGTFSPATVLIQCQNDSQCDDGNSCTVDDCPRKCTVRTTQDCNVNGDCGKICSVTNQPCTFDTDCPGAETCTRQDTCGPAVYCTNSPVANGTACGNPTPTGPCDLADWCQAGVCNSHPAANGTTCNDGLFCTENTTCTDGTCGGGTPNNCADAFSCTVDQCDEATDSCLHLPSNALCNDNQFCNGIETCNPPTGNPTTGCVAGNPPNCSSDGIACTEMDFCNETLDRCDGIPNNNLCPGGELCISGVGCSVSCDPPLAYPLGGKYIAVYPQPEGSQTPTSLLVSSPTWTCLNSNPEGGLYVGEPIPKIGFAPGWDFDGNGSIDGNRANLVDDPGQAGVLSSEAWGAYACDVGGVAWAPPCDASHPCPGGAACLPIKRCMNLKSTCSTASPCTVSLTACNNDGDCPAGETCHGGLVVVTDEDIAPSNWSTPRGSWNGMIVEPSVYEVQSDCGAVTSPASVTMRPWGDLDGNTLVSGIDLSLAVQGFQVRYHLPPLNPGFIGPDTIIPVVDITSAGFCTPEWTVNGTDILRLVKIFQQETYQQGAGIVGCSLPCP
ncbi:MAG: hypothetical protein J5J06_10265 [Phycisphaerae bacterium]|nr:hypothetical protein [Phycisphaerae bacterium]